MSPAAARSESHFSRTPNRRGKRTVSATTASQYLQRLVNVHIIDTVSLTGALRAYPRCTGDVARATAASPTLADPQLRQLGAADVQAWVAYWRKVGLFSQGQVA